MKAIYKSFSFVMAAVAMSMGTVSCDSDLLKFTDDDKGSYMPSDSEPISTTLEADENFSEFVNMLNYVDYYNALNQASDGVVFTAFVPTNDAMAAYYQSKGISSYEELGQEYVKELIKQHIYSGDSLKLTSKFGDSTGESYIFNSMTGDPDTITVDAEVDGFLLNNFAHTDRNYVNCTNGFFYTLEGVLDPIVQTVYDRISNNPNYSIMTAALAATGYDTEFATLADTVVELGASHISKRYYTFLSVSDATFSAAGINSLTDLKSALQNRFSGKEVTADSLLKQYVEYHTMDVKYSVAALQTMQGSDTIRIWETYAPDQIMTITSNIASIDSIFNEETSMNDCDTTYSYTINAADVSAQFVVSSSNISAKNGCVHEVSSWLPVYEPEQSTVVWDLADYTEVRNAAGSDYRPSAYVSSETKVNLSALSCYTVTSTETSNSSFYPVTYMTCKSNLKNCQYFDRVVFNLGYQGSVSMKTPTLVRGKYSVTISMAYVTTMAFMRTMKDCKGGLMRISFDDDNTKNVAPYTTISKSLAGVYSATLYDEIEFDSTGSHIFQMTVMDPAASTNSNFCLQFDCITFTPITE